MIRLHPVPDADHACPHCDTRLEVEGWYIPGMRTLAELRCRQCGREFYGDLPAGHGLYYPMLLERATGVVHDKASVDWFARWLGQSYANRTHSHIELIDEVLRPLRQPVLLNCLDTRYGHCLLKLLNAQYYLDRCPELDLVVLVPRFLRWMVPDGVAAIWTVDLSLRRGSEWNDWLAAELHRRIDDLATCRLSIALPHPHPEDYRIERFTGVRPFPVDEWHIRLDDPTITFIWREDRMWRKPRRYGGPRRLLKGLQQRLGLAKQPIEEQKTSVVALAQALREAFPKTDFAVAGVGHSGRLPDWITDLRTMEINDHVEGAWCERYSQSHVVIGIHGSNMLLPSAHAGSVIQLVPAERWGNLIQDILPAAVDAREAMWRHRFLPLDTSPTKVVEVAVSLLRRLPSALANFKRPWADHEAIGGDPWLTEKRHRETSEGLANP